MAFVGALVWELGQVGVGRDRIGWIATLSIRLTVSEFDGVRNRPRGRRGVAFGTLDIRFHCLARRVVDHLSSDPRSVAHLEGYDRKGWVRGIWAIDERWAREG